MITTEQHSLEQLQEMRDSLLVQAEIGALERQLAAIDDQSRLVVKESAWGDRISRDEHVYDGLGMSQFRVSDPRYSPISMPSDKARGSNYPIWQSESELAQIRGVCRVIHQTSEVAISALGNLVNYCVGKGFSTEVTPKAKSPSAEDKKLAIIVGQLVERFLDANDIEEEFDREEFVRLHRDGETYVGLEQGTGGIPEVRVADASFVTEPDSPRQLEEYLRERGEHVPDTPDAPNWTYGIASPYRDTSRADFTFVSWYGDNLQWDVYPDRHMVRSKLNVDREVKRGLSDLYPTWKNLTNADKLLTNTVEGAAIQATIAYIREHAEGVRNDQIEAFVAAQADSYTAQTIRGNEATRYERGAKSGRVVDMKQGAKYHAGPLGTLRQSVYIEVVQAALRLVGTRWQMPEYMISGDASNGNFASTLVAEAPFTKNAESTSRYSIGRRTRLIWKAIGLMCEVGLIREPLQYLKARLNVVVQGPQVAVRDRLESHQIRREEVEAGIRSRRSWAADADLDYDEEQSQRVDEQPSQPSDTGGHPETTQHSAEIDDRTKLAYPIASIITAVGRGDIPRDAGLGQLQRIFGFSRDEAETMLGSAGQENANTLATPAQVAEAWSQYP